VSGAKFDVRDDLDEVIARMVRPHVQDVAREAEKVAKTLAPPTKKWKSVGDAYVRKTHRAVDGVEIPDNLRFELDAYQYDIDHPDAVMAAQHKGGHDTRDRELAAGMHSFMLEPRDHTPRHSVQVVHCRCTAERDPNGVAKHVGSTEAVVSGTKASATVYADGPNMIQAEYGDEYGDGGSVQFVSPGTFFMRKTVGVMGDRA
jgi:hypothetical protein